LKLLPKSSGVSKRREGAAAFDRKPPSNRCLNQLYIREPPSGGAALLYRLVRGRRNGLRGPRIGGLEAGKDLISSVLEPCIRLVQLPGCLAGQLTQLVAIGHMRECPKYQIRTHHEFLLPVLAARRGLPDAVGAAGKPIQSSGYPNSRFQGLDARAERQVQNFARFRMLWKRPHTVSEIQIPASVHHVPCIPVPLEIKTRRGING